MSFHFDIDARDGKARAGRMVTPHGVIETPVFMPVGTLGTVKAVAQDVLEELGVQILLNNTYHLYLRPGVEMVRSLGGVQRFMAWDKPILTDSGGFQVFSLSELRKVTEDGVAFRSHLDGSSHMFTPESSIAAQIGLGADIIMAFDECTEHPAERERARSSMEMTLRWLKRSRDYFDEHKEEVVWGGSQLSVASSQLPVRTAGPSTRTANVRAVLAQDDAENAGPSAALRSARDDNPQNDADNRGPSTAAAKKAAFAQDDTGGNDIDPTLSQKRGKDGAPTSSVGVAPGQTQALFGIVQGGMYPDLRRESAERTVEIELPGYAIGGLSVGEPRNVTYEMVDAAIPYLPENKPRYLMGVGTPEEIVHYVAQGVDMMDCVLPTRAARHGLLFTSEGRLTIKNAQFARDEGPIDPKCGCKVCARYSRAYLRHLYASNELLAQTLNTVHNLAYYLDTMRRVRQAILLGEFATFLSGVRPPHLSVP
jgi:queuine/archaeosine tRNA-ribosyltransferase